MYSVAKSDSTRLRGVKNTEARDFVQLLCFALGTVPCSQLINLSRYNLQQQMKRTASMTMTALNCSESSLLRCQRLRMKTTHLFTYERQRPEATAVLQIEADANPAAAVRHIELPPRKVSDNDSPSDSCISNSLIMQLASINIKEEKRGSTAPPQTLKRSSIQFSLSKPLQSRIKVAKRASSSPACLTSKKKRVHSRRRNRVVILNNNIVTSSQTQGRGGSDSSLQFEPLSLGSIVTP